MHNVHVIYSSAWLVGGSIFIITFVCVSWWAAMYIVLETPPPHPCMYMYVEYAAEFFSYVHILYMYGGFEHRELLILALHVCILCMTATRMF